MRDTEWFAGRGVDEAPPARPTVLAWKFWALLVAVAIVVPLACSGCAAPICAVPTMDTVVTEEGVFYVFDEANFRIEQARIDRLAKGKCRLRGKGET